MKYLGQDENTDTVANPVELYEQSYSRQVQPLFVRDHKRHPVLLATAASAVQACAMEIAEALNCTVEVAETRKSAMALLRRREFSAIVIDDALAEADLASADQLWQAAGMAVPLQVNFAISSSARVVRELRAALYRRQVDESRARAAAEFNLQADIGSALTGITIELDLLRIDGDFSAEFRERLAGLTDLTTALRRKLTPATAKKAAVRAVIGAVKANLRADASRNNEIA